MQSNVTRTYPGALIIRDRRHQVGRVGYTALPNIYFSLLQALELTISTIKIAAFPPYGHKSLLTNRPLKVTGKTELSLRHEHKKDTGRSKDKKKILCRAFLSTKTAARFMLFASLLCVCQRLLISSWKIIRLASVLTSPATPPMSGHEWSKNTV